MPDVKTSAPVNYQGGPNGGQTLFIEGDPEQRVELPGGTYVLDNSGDGPACYRWEVDPERADKTPRDGDEASALLAEHGGATPRIEQDVTSSTTIAGGTAVQEPKRQEKVATGTADKDARASRGLKTTDAGKGTSAPRS